MGIKGLAKVIGDHAPNAIKENEMKNYFGRKIAIDASMSIYQFLIAVRQDGSVLQNDQGETTSHLMGMFYRTIRMVDNGIKPLYVFDGKPPEMKSDELGKRGERRQEAEEAHKKAVETGDTEAADKFSRRLVKVTREHSEECKQLLALMGIPYIDAPCEAEAQCAALVSAGKVYATATEDMDGLTFGTNILLRHMTFSEAKKMPIQEFHLDKVLSGFDMTMDSFVDLCILLGCDYCGTIRGVGPKKAFDLITQHKSIENALEHIDQTKYPPPENWPYAQARKLFVNPEVADSSEVELKWKEPDVDAVVKYMCTDKGFSEDRIRNSLQKLVKGKHSATQGRIDSFFTATRTVSTEPSSAKRKSVETKPSAKNSAKKAKTGKFGRGK